MFCPQCKAEYREGFTRCYDCDVELVPTLEAAMTVAPVFEGEDGLVPFHVTNHPDQLGLLLERLEDERIPYAITAGTALCLLDGHPLPEPGLPDFWEARILVLASLQAKAETIWRTLAV